MATTKEPVENFTVAFAKYVKDCTVRNVSNLTLARRLLADRATSLDASITKLADALQQFVDEYEANIKDDETPDSLEREDVMLHALRAAVAELRMVP